MDRPTSQDPDVGGTEAHRLEELWAGDFGDQYADRNAQIDERRERFWSGLLDRFQVGNVLEVGCGQGGNLRPLARRLQPEDIWGVDVNILALDRARRHAPGSNLVRAPARDLPFRDGWFDLVFTAGVLIHQPDDTLSHVIAEVVRCSRRYVLWIEYHADERVEVPYRGQSGALIKRDYGRLYREVAPGLEVRDQGFLGHDEGFDNATWQLLEKPSD
jgi:pseudaminic acid biosynthesis-associated methylase